MTDISRWRVDTTYEPRVINGKLIMVRTGTPKLVRVTDFPPDPGRTPPHGDPLNRRTIITVAGQPHVVRLLWPGLGKIPNTTTRDIERSRIDGERAAKGLAPLTPQAHEYVEGHRWETERGYS
jgi:hypothetical protein